MSVPVPEHTDADAAAAVGELRILVHRLADEAASFRRRAIAAEARSRELEATLAESSAAPAPDDTAGVEAGALDPARVAELSAENAELRERLAVAAERTRQLLDRARFLRQQQEDVPA